VIYRFALYPNESLRINWFLFFTENQREREITDLGFISIIDSYVSLSSRFRIYRSLFSIGQSPLQEFYSSTQSRTRHFRLYFFFDRIISNKRSNKILPPKSINSIKYHFKIIVSSLIPKNYSLLLDQYMKLSFAKTKISTTHSFSISHFKSFLNPSAVYPSASFFLIISSTNLLSSSWSNLWSYNYCSLNVSRILFISTSFSLLKPSISTCFSCTSKFKYSASLLRCSNSTMYRFLSKSYRSSIPT